MFCIQSRKVNIFKLVELHGIKRAQRAFRMKLFSKQPMCEPNILIFRRILETKSTDLLPAIIGRHSQKIGSESRMVRREIICFITINKKHRQILWSWKPTWNYQLQEGPWREWWMERWCQCCASRFSQLLRYIYLEQVPKGCTRQNKRRFVGINKEATSRTSSEHKCSL